MRGISTVRRRCGPLLLAAVVMPLALSGCTTGGKAGETGEAESGAAAPSEERRAKAGDTSSGYTDPALVSASSSGYGADGMNADGAPGMAGSELDQANTLAPGVVTQPTGIRAGSNSIFSGGAPAAAPPSPGAAPAVYPAGRIDARSGSVFSAPVPVPAGTCGTDVDGYPLSC